MSTQKLLFYIIYIYNNERLKKESKREVNIYIYNNERLNLESKREVNYTLKKAFVLPLEGQ